MKSDEAIDNFFGRNGKKRLNCAQSVAAVFINNGFFSEEDFFDLKNCGFGKAPQGYCGSVYAAHCILGKVSKAKAEKFNNEFIPSVNNIHYKFNMK